MRNTIINILIFSLILPTFLGFAPVSVSATSTEAEVNNVSNINNYTNYNSSCANGQSLTIEEFAIAYTSGKINFNLATNTANTIATFTMNNSTGCTAPISLSSYKMYDTTLSHQELYSGTGLIYATSSTSINVELPGCMAQIDAWYGQYPEILLDSNPYGYPNNPFVLAFKFLYNNNSGYHNAEGNFCVKEVNQAPVINLVGQNPFSVTVGNAYIDQGATALDKEDGDITSKIVSISTVNTNVVGTYIVKYNVTDSAGLKAVEVVRTVEVVPAPVEIKTAVVSATKIVCDSETDLPNYGAGGPDMGSTTVTTFLATHPNCRIAPWTFEWVKNGTTSANPGDQMSIGGGDWKPFSSTSTIPAGEKIWVREQFVNGYIPFTGVNTTQAVSAELYCHTDVLNYDNYDWISPVANGQTYYCVAWNVLKTTTPVNHAPVITLVGANPAEVNVGEVFVDPGATANDNEDGNITANIIASSTVNTTIPGTYTITYNVKDSQGLAAIEVTRTVNVLNLVPTNRGKITVCLIIADAENQIATSSNGLPVGDLKIDIGTTTSDVASSTIFKSQTWQTEVFSPNKKAILNVNDAECVTLDNLPLGIYTYSQVTRSLAWSNAKLSFNDQDTQPVNNVFDFFPYGNVNTNSDGYIVLDDYRYERTLYVLSKYNPAPQCTLPVITSPIIASVTVGTPFTYAFTASSTTSFEVASTTLPAWLSYATSTNVISGTPTTVGVYNVAVKAINTCGFDARTIAITVTSAGGGGGGGTGTSSDLEVVKTSDKSTASVGDTITYTITLVNKGPNEASTTVTDLLPSTLTFVSATSTLGSYATTTGVWTIGNIAINSATTTLTIVATVNAGTQGQKITNTAVATSNQNDPTPLNNTSSTETSINPAGATGGGVGGGGGAPSGGVGGGGGAPSGGGGGGNGPIVGSFGGGNGQIFAPVIPTTPNSCYYLYDYLRKDFNNNPVEVKKLQVFLRDLEGFTKVQVTGVYDDQTIVALDSFQERYKADILTPWGHTEATSYTYILTKKKVNEIYCKMAFPVNTQQQEEIDSYRAFLQGLRDAGINIDGGVPVNTPSNPSNGVDGQVGVKPTDKDPNGNQTTLAGISSTTQKFLTGLTANVLASAKGFMNYLLGFFGLPVKELGEKTNQSVDMFLGLGFLNWVLIFIIIVISYLWYREYNNNKNIEEINKEIDLE